MGPLYISTPVEKWEGEGIRAKKIRLYPTVEQKKILRNWMGARRYVYNKVLASINNGEKINSFELRNKYVTSKTRDGQNNPLIKEWEKKIPKDIRNGAIRDLVKNYKVCFSNKKNKNVSSVIATNNYSVCNVINNCSINNYSVCNK